MVFKEAIILIFSGFVGSLGFALFFRMTKSKIIYAALGGAVTCIAYVICCHFFENEFYQNLFPALIATAYSEILARLTKAPSTAYIIISIISLVPGGKLYYTMYNFITNNDALFMEYLTATARIAGGLAVGIIIVSVIIKEINYSKFKQIYDME